MTGAVLALMSSTASGGGGGGGGSSLAGTVNPANLDWYFNGYTYTASATAIVTGGLEPYTIDWFISGGDANTIFAANGAITVESVTGDDAEIYFQVTDANTDEATSNTAPITLPA